MAKMPIEIVRFGYVPEEALDQAISLANSLQDEFVYTQMPTADAQPLQIHTYDRISAPDFADTIEEFRTALRGFHPFLIAFVDSYMDGAEYRNMFADGRAEKGIGIVTIHGVPELIIPLSRIESYFLYYLARYTLDFIVPDHVHHETRGCVYDEKLKKTDLLKNMKNVRVFCDECRTRLLRQTALSSRQYDALIKMFNESGRRLGMEYKLEEMMRLIEEASQLKKEVKQLPRAFIGSSVEGLQVAQQLQLLLEYDLSTEIWNQGTVFGLGSSTLEALEQAVRTYDFGIFVFTPDDRLQTRGETKPVARDNVLFELGLFIGQLTRKRAFVVHPSGKAVSLPSDLAGITTATYDPDKPNLAAALGPACQRIRDAVALLEPH